MPTSASKQSKRQMNARPLKPPRQPPQSQTQPTPQPRRKKGALTALGVLLLCIGSICVLAGVAAAVYWIYQRGGVAGLNLGASESWSAADIQEAGSQLSELHGILQFTGEEIQDDTDGDGQIDEFSYQYPSEMVADMVMMTPGLVYRHAEPGHAPAKVLRLMFQNLSQEQKAFQLTYEVPKEFAASVDDLTFSLDPARVVEPDPIVVFNILLPAPPVQAPEPAEGPSWNPDAQYLMMGASTIAVATWQVRRSQMLSEAAQQMERACKKLPVDQRSQCWLSMVDDFQEVLSAQKVKALCAETIGLERRICLAIANGSPNECDRASTKQAIQICKGYYVDRECSKVDDGERQYCLKTLSIKNKAFLPCGDLTDPDVQNECYALAGGGARFCDDILNESRRAGCKQALQSSSQQAQQPLFGGDSSDPAKWWADESQAQAACARLAGVLPGYKLVHTQAGETLSCGYEPAVGKPDQYLLGAHIEITGYATIADASEAWNAWAGPDSALIRTFASTESSDPDRAASTIEADRYFATFLKYDNTNYDVKAGALYRNAIITFDETKAPNSGTSTWSLVEQLARQMIDEKSK